MKTVKTIMPLPEVYVKAAAAGVAHNGADGQEPYSAAAEPLVEAAPPAPAPNEDPPADIVSAAVSDERARVCAIMSLGLDSQRKLAEKLIKEGASEGDAAKAFLADLKAGIPQNAEGGSPAAIAQEMLSRMKSGIPDIPATAAEGKPDICAIYASIKDPRERAVFAKEHKKELSQFSGAAK